MAEFAVERLHGDQIEARIDALAALRIRVFREWPYLYDGDLDYERDYLQTYVASPSSLAFLVLNAGEVVGATTALPLADEEAAFRAPMVEAGFDPGTTFYFGESILLPAYRGRGLGHTFFDEREARARELGYATTCFCAVQRPADHPARPSDYVPLDAFWQSRGYRPRPDIVAHYAWTDVGDEAETEKPLMFWTRPLDPR